MSWMPFSFAGASLEPSVVQSNLVLPCLCLPTPPAPHAIHVIRPRALLPSFPPTAARAPDTSHARNAVHSQRPFTELSPHCSSGSVWLRALSGDHIDPPSFIVWHGSQCSKLSCTPCMNPARTRSNLRRSLKIARFVSLHRRSGRKRLHGCCRACYRQ